MILPPADNQARHFLCFATVLLAMLLASPATAVGAPQASPNPELMLDGEYEIGAGDILEVSVWREPDLQRKVVVRIDGRISLPLLGDIQAAGLTIKDLNQFLTMKFQRFVSKPIVGTILLESRSKRYYMIGKIANPGEYAIDSPITVLQALARAGGFAEWAKTSKIIIVRRQIPKEITLEFDYETMLKGSDLEQNILIKPGDTIIVP